MKHVELLKLSLFALLTATMIGCHVKSETFVPPVKDPEMAIGPSAKHTEVKFNPKTDVVFIIDDSLSMLTHQENLKKNVNLFVSEVGKDQVVDMHFGVTPTFDSVRYGTIVPKVCEQNGEVLFEDNGALLKPKAPEGKSDLLKLQPSNFIKRAEGFTDILAETLKIGVRAYKQGHPCPNQGAKYEEYFTTIKSIVELGENGGPNSAFYRGTNSHLVVFIVSDTGDGSYLQAADVYNFLREKRGDPEGKSFTIHAVADLGHVCSSRIGSEIDQSGDAKKTEQLVKLANGQLISMCDPQYGAKLAKLGSELRKKVTENMTLQLQHIPEEGTLKLFLGKTELKDGTWAYNPSTKTITILDGVPWSQHPGESIQVKYIPVDIRRKQAVKLN